MGNICASNQGNAPADPITGLTAKEIHLIKKLWFKITEQATLKESGMEFFRRLLTKHPYMKTIFPEFWDYETGMLNNNIPLRAHSVSVFCEISKYLDYIDEPETLVGLIEKRTKGHYFVGVTGNDMENFRGVMLDYLEEKGDKMDKLPDALEAWNKFLTLHNLIFQKKSAEMSEKLNREAKIESDIDVCQSDETGLVFRAILNILDQQRLLWHPGPAESGKMTESNVNT